MNKDTLFQAGTILSLLQGVYEGDVTVSTLASKGDTGLGTFNGVDGELVALDGDFYRIDVNGAAMKAPANTCTPFAVVSHFKPQIQVTLSGVKDLDTLNRLIDGHLPTFNTFYMVRIEIDAEEIQLRSESPQKKPYRPLTETLAEVQKAFGLKNSRGTLVGLRSPGFSSRLSVPGYHFHYIDQERKKGGHVFNLKLTSAKVGIQPLHGWEIALFNNALFHKANLDVDVEGAVEKVEKDPQH